MLNNAFFLSVVSECAVLENNKNKKIEKKTELQKEKLINLLINTQKQTATPEDKEPKQSLQSNLCTGMLHA